MGSSGASAAPVSPVNLTTVAAGTVLANKLAAGDANAAFAILGDGTHEWGPGGAGALDTILTRGGSARLNMTGQGGVQEGFSHGGTTGSLFGVISSGQRGMELGGDVDLHRSAGGEMTLAGALKVANELSVTTLGNGLRVKEGANGRQGVATLVAGAVTIANTTVTANTRIFLEVQALGGVALPTALAITARTAGTSFTVTSASAADTSTFAWLLLEPA